MAKVLILDGDGRRRIHLEVLAQKAGHIPLSAGSLQEAMWVAEVYGPEYAVVADSLPDATKVEVKKAFAASSSGPVRRIKILDASGATLPPELQKD